MIVIIARELLRLYRTGTDAPIEGRLIDEGSVKEEGGEHITFWMGKPQTKYRDPWSRRRH